MPDVQAQIQETLDELTRTGMERGIQVAAYLDGELVVDAWAGVADRATGQPVDGETLFTAFSATKGLSATVVHRLADRGLVDYDVPIATYWPEFGRHGKERITLRHALSHRAALPQMPEGVGPDEMGDWETMCARIAELTPLWEPGTHPCYHAFTYGWIIGEVARRVTGHPFGVLVQEEICTPLGISSLYLGLPARLEVQVATLESVGAPEAGEQAAEPESAAAPEGDPLSPDTLWPLAIPPALTPFDVIFNRPDVRRASIPAAGGLLTARALARHYAALAGSARKGDSLLSAACLAEATRRQTPDVDLLLGLPWALGYLWASPTVFGHSGAGGSLGVADRDHHFACGVTKNLMGSGDTATRLVREIATALGLPLTTASPDSFFP